MHKKASNTTGNSKTSPAGDNRLGTEPIPRLVIRYAVPSIAAMAVNSTYSLVDQIFLNLTIGHIGIAATTVTNPIVTLGLAAALTLGGGGAALAAIRMGEDDNAQAEKLLGCSVCSIVIFTAIMSALGLIFLDPLLRFFGASGAVLPYAHDYARIIVIGLIFTNLSVGLTNYIRNDGAPMVSMLSMITGASMNVVLNIIFVLNLNYGVKGSAMATLLSQALSSAINLFYLLFCAKIRLKAGIRKLLASLTLIAGVVKTGFASCIKHVANAVVSVVLNRVVYHYGEMTSIGGDIAMSALGGVMKVNMLLVSVIVGISTGCQPIFGYNMGAGNTRRVRSAYFFSVISASIVSAVFFALMQLFPRQIIAMLGTREVKFAIFSEKALVIFLFGFFTVGFQIVSSNFFLAIGKPVKATVLSMLQQAVFLIPLVLILPLKYRLDGVLYAAPIADFAATAVIGAVTFFEIKRLGNNVKV